MTDPVEEYERRVAAAYERYRVDPSGSRDPAMSFDEALHHVERQLGSPVDSDQLEASLALEAENWWFVPLSWIGCSGFFVDKKDGAIHQLGSCHPIDLCFWAHERGFRELNDLVIDEITDMQTTVSFLCDVLRFPDSSVLPPREYPRSTVSRRCESLPARFAHQAFWFLFQAFRDIEETGAFRYHLEPTSGPVVEHPVTG